MADLRPMICWVVDRVELGGDGRYLLETLKTLDRSPYRFHVVSLHTPDTFAIDVQKLAVPVHSLDLPAEDHPRRSYWTFAGTMTLFNLLRKMRPEVVHTLGPRAEVVGRIAARLAGVPRLLHSERWDRPASGVRRMVARMTGSWLDCAVVPTASFLEPYSRSRSLHPSRIRVQGPRIAPLTTSCQAEDGEDPWSGARPLIGTIGRPCPAQGTHVLIDAMALVLRYHRSAHLLCAGSHLAGVRCLHQARSLGIIDRVHLPGQRHDVPGLLGAMDVFVMPQSMDRLPLSLLEAMSVGRPCIVSRLPMVQEQFEDGEEVLMVPAGEPGLLADAIDRVLTDEELKLRLGEGARAAIANRFSSENQKHALGDLYDLLVRT